MLSLTGLPGVLVADEPPAADAPAPQPRAIKAPAQPAPPMPWIGLEVGKLERAMRAHVSDVPEGVGFLITSITAEGPAEKAGLQRFDVLWKLEDQLLINEAQFGTLLRMRKPGDQVELSVVRAGQHEKVRIELGEAPPAPVLAEIPAAEIPLYPSGIPGMPKTIVYPLDRTAEVTREDGSVAKLHYKDNEPHVLIVDAEGKTVYDGPLRKDGMFAVPEEWNCSVGALLRTMHRAKGDQWKPRSPRPRVVLPPGKTDG